MAIPKCVTRVSESAFCRCESLKGVRLLSRLVKICEDCFFCSGIGETTLHSALGEVGEYTFRGCQHLKAVWAEEGCALEVGQYVQDDV